MYLSTLSGTEELLISVGSGSDDDDGGGGGVRFWNLARQD